MIGNNLFERNATKFIAQEMAFPRNVLISKHINAKTRTIELLYIGAGISHEQLAKSREKLTDFGLKKTELKVDQGLGDSLQELPQGFTSQGENAQNLQILGVQKEKIEELQSELNHRVALPQPDSFLREAAVLFPGIRKLAVTPALLGDAGSDTTEQIYLAYLAFHAIPSYTERQKIEKWLEFRLGSNHVRLFIEKSK
jgi:hypothetical protein